MFPFRNYPVEIVPRQPPPPPAPVEQLVVCLAKHSFLQSVLTTPASTLSHGTRLRWSARPPAALQ